MKLVPRRKTGSGPQETPRNGVCGKDRLNNVHGLVPVTGFPSPLAFTLRIVSLGGFYLLASTEQSFYYTHTHTHTHTHTAHAESNAPSLDALIHGWPFLPKTPTSKPLPAWPLFL